jgi:hypothetical protein
MYPKCKHYNILLCNTYIWGPSYTIIGELKVIEMEDSKVFGIPISLVKKCHLQLQATLAIKNQLKNK